MSSPSEESMDVPIDVRELVDTVSLLHGYIEELDDKDEFTEEVTSLHDSFVRQINESGKWHVTLKELWQETER